MAGPAEDPLISAQIKTEMCGEIETNRGKYCPDELEENRREMNEPRRRLERDAHKDAELQNINAESPI